MTRTMSNVNLGLWIFGGAMAICVGIAMFVTYLYPIEWFRVRILSDDRWTRATGMLPFVFPVYLIAGLAFSFLRNN